MDRGGQRGGFAQEAPRMLGRYHVLGALGEDALGVLHLARFEGPNGFQRWALVRRMHAHLAADGALVRAFYDGARLAARLQHQNVATTFDVSEGDMPPWMAFEYVHGETVEDLIACAISTGRPVPWDIAARIVADAALGIEAIAEMRKTLVSDEPYPSAPVAPNRIVVTYDGKAKIFEGCSPTAADARSLPYTAPERLRSGGDVRAEVFGLGVILWELVAGRRLFAGQTEQETRALLRAHVIPSVRSIVRCPTKLEEILMCTVAADPGERFQTARALARALESVIVGKGLVLTDEDVARYLLGIFPDRFEERQEALASASNVTEVFRREDLGLPVPSPDTERDIVALVDTADVPTARRIQMHEEPAPRAAGGSPHVLRTASGQDIDDPTVPREVATVPRDVATVPREVATVPRYEVATVPTYDVTTVPTYEVATVPREPAAYGMPPAVPPVPFSAAPAARPLPAAMPPLPPPPPPPLPPVAMAPAAPAATADPSATAWILLVVAVVAVAIVIVVKVTLVHRERERMVGAVTTATATPTLPSTQALTAAPTVPPATTATAAVPTAIATPMGTAVSTAIAPPPPTATAIPNVTSTAVATRTPPPPQRPPRPPPPPPRTDLPHGLLTVVCAPACDDVRDGSRSLGASPIFKASVPAGDHRLTLRWSDPPSTRVVNISVTSDETTLVKLSPEN